MDPGSFLHNLTLIERVPRVCRLAPADAAFLLAEHCAHLELIPTTQRHRYRLTALGYVGVLLTPNCRIVIRPKIPLRNLFYFLDASTPLSTLIPSARLEGNELVGVLGRLLAQRMEERSHCGLHRDYVENQEEGPFLHGPLDLPTQLRQTSARKDRLHSRPEDLTMDVLWNQIPRATAERLLICPLVPESVGIALRQGLRGFEAVRSLPLNRDTFALPGLQRAPADYRTLLELCRIVVEGLSPTDGLGEVPAPAFLLDMERVFERYVTRGIWEEFASSQRHTVGIQTTHTITPQGSDLPTVAVRPDVTITESGRPVLVVDAKWKRPPWSSVVTSDLYQMLAYCIGLGVERAVLVYPGRRDGIRVVQLANAAIWVEIRMLRVTASPQRCRRSLQHLSRALRS
jgi:5-methylcytosine-specific restriction enzyme subunit McrC